jgi:hypothetical protein
VHDRQGNKIGKASVQAEKDVVGGSGKGKDNTQREPVKKETSVESVLCP